MATFLGTLFRHAEAAVELRACRNEYGGGAVSLMTGNKDEVALFVQRNNRDGWGVYFGVCTRRVGSPTGARADVVEAPAVWLDIDCRKLGVSGDAAIRALDTCPCPPSIIVNSGNGLHAYWMLHEPVNVEEIDGEAERRLVAVMKQLVGVFAGDSKCCELARILRLPGTHNSKDVAKAANNGEPLECHVISMEGDRRYELDDLEDWLAMQRPLIVVAPSLTAPAVPDDVFAAYARKAGLHPPVDIAGALAAMTLGGDGDSSIHQTQLRVSSSMASRGHDEEEIVALLMKATMDAAGAYAASWNWRREEQNLRGMIATARKKFPIQAKEAALPQATVAARASGAQASVGASATVTDLSDARTKRKAKATAIPAADTADVPGRSATEAIARGVIAKIGEERGRLVTLTGNEMYLVEAGRWRVFTPALDAWLDREINGMTRGFQKEPKPALMAGIKNMIRTMPELHRDQVELDTGDWIACRDASINVTTGEIAEHTVEHLTTIGVDCAIRDAKPGEGIDRWRAFLAEAFSNLSASDKAAMIGTLQEIMGAALVRVKPRELSKAAILHGPTGCGKTTVANLLRHLLGGSRRCAAISIKELGDKFGMQALVGKAAWIGDDAIGLGDRLDAERFKLIATNEDMSISRKNLPDWEGRLNIAVLLTANHTPRIIDTSNAVYARLLIMPMMVGHGDDGNSAEMNAALRAELAGILLWAVEGWQRLKARGRYDPPEIMTKATATLRETNNPLQTCFAECIELSEHWKVHRRDLLCMVRGWYEETHGAAPRGRELSPQTLIGFMRDRFPELDYETLRANSDRWTGGLKMLPAGLAHWDRYRTEHNVQGKSVSYAKTVGAVNSALMWEAPF